MATLSEVLRGTRLEYAVLAGASALGRDVRRILDVRPPIDRSEAPGFGDLVVYSLASRSPVAGEVADRALSALLSSGVAGVLTDSPPGTGVVEMAEKNCVPLLCMRHDTRTAQDFKHLEQSLEMVESRLRTLQQEIEQDLSDLARAGATAAMVLQRVVEITGKTGLLQGPNALVEHVQPTAQHKIEASLVKQAIRETDPAVRSWIRETADPSVAPVLYLEVPNHGLVRLVSPVWIDGRVDAAVSLLTSPADLTGRDRYGLLAAARTIAITSVDSRVDPPVAFARRTCGELGALAFRAPAARLETLADAVRQRLDVARGALRLGREDVRVWLPYRTADHWHRFVHEWHAQLSKDVGSVSIGHSLRRRTIAASDATNVVVQAAEAALVGERLFGPGYITSYADAQLAKFLLTQHSTAELRSLYERAVGKLAADDQMQKGELLPTLEVYCETFVMKRTGERLGVHRNTVLYRLKRIEEITSCDLEDGRTRLLFQIGLLAGRLLRQTSAGRQSISGAWASGTPLKAAI